MLKTSLFFLILFMSITAWGQYVSPAGQASTTTDTGGWSWISIEGKLVGDEDESIRHLGNFRYFLEFHFRTQGGGDEFQNAIIRPYLGYDLDDNSTVWVGYAYVPFEKNGKIYREHRLVQMLTYRTKLGEKKSTLFMSKTRLEQRHVENSEEISVRIRQLAKIAIPLPFVPKEKNISIFFAEEIIMNLNSTESKGNFGALENRLNIGLTQKFKLFKSPASFNVYYLNRTDFKDINYHGVGFGLMINPQWGMKKKKNIPLNRIF